MLTDKSRFTVIVQAAPVAPVLSQIAPTCAVTTGTVTAY